jgi:hypothetical protein
MKEQTRLGSIALDRSFRDAAHRRELGKAEAAKELEVHGAHGTRGV